MQRNYCIVNRMYALIIGLTFLYSFIYSGNNQYPMQCYYQVHFHSPCPTCGLSRGFSAIMRGKLALAAGYNRNAIPLFCFFSIQLLIRLAANLALTKLKGIKRMKWLAMTDAVLSTALFIVAFHALILNVAAKDYPL